MSDTLKSKSARHSADQESSRRAEATGRKNRIEAAKALGERMIEKEIARCRRGMGEDAWSLYGDWVTENIVCAAKIWLARELKEGRL
ncbi:hypothetical protein [Caballeronia sp. INSB1]|uniref:hypothetical protein n=1 Tax=Caballeronia sp. INSB1 TaxID=2921751 RepID=UPI002032BE94|nr:hypothetical protein [Caballeronia sp. INSB1]